MKTCAHYLGLLALLLLMPAGLLPSDHENNQDALTAYYNNLEVLELLQTKAPDGTEQAASEFDGPFIPISLGCNCEPAYQLRQRKLSGAFFPFDWMRTENFNVVTDMIAQGFQNFLRKENLVVMPRISPTAPCVFVMDNKHHMKFVHDFPWDKTFEASYDEVKQKYDRRIARFYRALSAGKPIYFFRRNFITKAQAIRFCDVMYKKFPGLKFTLVVMHNSAECKKKWHVKNVDNFFYEATHTGPKLSWAGYYTKPWDDVLTSLGITWAVNVVQT